MSSGLTCPCGTGRKFDACCGRILNGSIFASTAEELMRSRYSAFATGNVHYLLQSWHPRTRPLVLNLESSQVWIQLDVLATTGGSLLDQVGTVEFVAHYRVGSKDAELHENSTFERFDGKWQYLAPLAT